MPDKKASIPGHVPLIDAHDGGGFGLRQVLKLHCILIIIW